MAIGGRAASVSGMPRVADRPEATRARGDRWPLPALAVWSAAWCVDVLGRALGLSPAAAFLAAAALGVAATRLGRTTSRRALIALGFPLSFVATGAAADLPPWLWLAPLALLAVVYPVRRWGDAPLFPTPATALRGLSALSPLSAGSRILDAGSGSGAALRALHVEYPEARLDGIEWSAPLCWLSAWRCPWATIRRGDIWAADWSVYDMVYVFQRPETMERAARKAAAELQPGAMLVSLEFAVTSAVATTHLRGADGRCVWIYRADVIG